MTIVVSTISFTNGLTPLDQHVVTFSTDLAWDAGAVVLLDASSNPVASAVAERTGLDGRAVFPPGCVPEGTFTLRVVVASLTPDEGQGTAGPFVVAAIDPAVDIVYTKFIEAIQQTLIDSGILPELNDTNVLIFRASLLDRIIPEMDPGVMLVRAGFDGGGEFHTITERLLTFRCLVLVGDSAKYDGELDTEERRKMESLTHRIFQGLDANNILGGVLDMPLAFELYDPFAQGRVINQTQFWESLTTSGQLLL